MKQKEKFLESEGNGWFLRNQKAIKDRKFPEDDPVLRELVTLPSDSGCHVFY